MLDLKFGPLPFQVGFQGNSCSNDYIIIQEGVDDAATTSWNPSRTRFCGVALSKKYNKYIAIIICYKIESFIPADKSSRIKKRLFKDPNPYLETLFIIRY